MSILNALRRWRDLDGRQRVRLLGFVVALPMLRLSLYLRGYTRTRAVIERWTRRADTRTPSPRDLQSAQDLARLAEIAGRRGFAVATCLPQALAVYAALRRRGFAPALQIGVRKQDGHVEAHAWVELAGVPLAQHDLCHTALPMPSNPVGPALRKVWTSPSWTCQPTRKSGAGPDSASTHEALARWTRGPAVHGRRKP